MHVLSREQILAAPDLQIEQVAVPEWGEAAMVNIRVFSGADRDAWEASVLENGKANMDNLRAKLLSFAICDEQGTRLFSMSDVAALGNKNGVALGRLVEVAKRLNKIGKDEEDTAKGNS